MKRCLLAAAILLVVDFGLVSADFIVVKVDLNQLTYWMESKAAQAAATAKPGGPGQPPNMPPPNYGKGGKGSSKGKGFQSPPPPMPQPQPGATGQPKAPPPDIDPLFVYAYVETSFAPNKMPASAQWPFEIWEIDCKLGTQKSAKLYVQGMSGELNYWQVKTPGKGFDKKLQDDLKDATDDAKKIKLVYLAEWALQRGLLPEFNKCIDELKKVDAKNAIVTAVERTREDLKKRPAVDDPSAQALTEDLQKEEYHAVVSEPGHYTLLTNIKATVAQETELKKKLTKLEEVYSTFFFWHALKGQNVNGQQLTPPNHRLTVVLVDTPNGSIKEFNNKRAVFNFATMVGSGFAAQRDNVVLYTALRLDEPYGRLQLDNQTLWNRFGTRGDEVFSIGALMAKRLTPTNGAALLQTLALCQKSMSDENEVLTLSNLGVRQLIAATGLLPRNLQTAEWARAGLASFFEIPEQSFYPCTGGPNWVHLIEFKHWRKAKKIEAKDAKEVMLKVIADEYFHQAVGTLKLAVLNKDDRLSLEQQAEEELKVARATSWSLMHFLVHNKNAQLQRYFEELRGLPRDTDFDGRVLRDCFYRAFGLMTQDTANPGRQMVDVRKLESLAAAWFNSVDLKQLDSVEYEAQALKWLDPSNFLARKPQIGTTPANATPGAYPGAFPPGIGKR